jgi:hypothetical protein
MKAMPIAMIPLVLSAASIACHFVLKTRQNKFSAERFLPKIATIYGLREAI